MLQIVKYQIKYTLKSTVLDSTGTRRYSDFILQAHM